MNDAASAGEFKFRWNTEESERFKGILCINKNVEVYSIKKINFIILLWYLFSSEFSSFSHLWSKPGFILYSHDQRKNY